jgi:3-methyladenine DNA glycosylase AlkD
MKYEEIIKLLKSKADKKNLKGMVRFGISPKNTLGVSVPVLRNLAKKIGRNQELAKRLWNSEIHEARLLACFIGEADKLSEGEMENWVKEFDSWDICDQVCANLFDKTGLAWEKAIEWTKREKEFVKRAGFVLMATLAVHDKKAKNKDFERFFPLIEKHSSDERNFVRKAINWALRQIGKRNLSLNKKAIKLAEEIKKIDSKSSRWIASDALRELRSKQIQNKFKK